MRRTAESLILSYIQLESFFDLSQVKNLDISEDPDSVFVISFRKNTTSGRCGCRFMEPEPSIRSLKSSLE